MKYTELSAPELLAEKEKLQAKYDEYAAMGLKLDMSRGKPDTAQLDLSKEILGIVATPEDCISE